MIVGDLVAYDGKRWLVSKVDRPLKVALLSILSDDSGQKSEVPLEWENPPESKLSVIANPTETWPFITVVGKKWAGPLLQIEQPRPRRHIRILHRGTDWVPVDPSQEGGVIFFDPALKLKIGDFLVGTHRSGAIIRMTVPPTFGTVLARVARSAQVKKVEEGPKSSFNRILDEDDEGE